MIESTSTISSDDPRAVEAAIEAQSAPQGPRPLQSVYTVKSVLSGDTIEIAGGRVVHLVGLRAPGPGEPYFVAAHDTLRWLLPAGTIVRVYFTADATAEDTRLDAWMWFQLNDRQRDYYSSALPAGMRGIDEATRARLRQFPFGRGASVSGFLLRSGLAHLDPEYESIRLAKIDDSGETVVQPPEWNARIHAALRRSRDQARDGHRGLWSGSHHD